MGTLHYGSRPGYELDDRTLAHLQLLFAAKLRRGESFLLNWSLGPEGGNGRMSLWIAPFVPVMIRFSGSRTPAINRDWLNRLMIESFSPTGVDLTSEAEFEAQETTGG